MHTTLSGYQTTTLHRQAYINFPTLGSACIQRQNLMKAKACDKSMTIERVLVITIIKIRNNL